MGENKENKIIKLRKIFGFKKNEEGSEEGSDPKEKKSIIKTMGPTNFVIILMVGILLLILSWPSGSKKESNDKKANKENDISKEVLSKLQVSKNQTEIYVSSLEKRLEDTLKKVEGIDDVEVMITIKASKELIVLKDKPYSKENQIESDETLLEVIDNANVSSEDKSIATQEVIKLTAITEKENAAESLLEAKGYSDAIIRMSEERVSVVVNAVSLDDKDIAQIEDIVKRETGADIGEIVISAVVFNE